MSGCPGTIIKLIVFKRQHERQSFKHVVVDPEKWKGKAQDAAAAGQGPEASGAHARDGAAGEPAGQQAGEEEEEVFDLNQHLQQFAGKPKRKKASGECAAWSCAGLLRGGGCLAWCAWNTRAAPSSAWVACMQLLHPCGLQQATHHGLAHGLVCICACAHAPMRMARTCLVPSTPLRLPMDLSGTQYSCMLCTPVPSTAACCVATQVEASVSLSAAHVRVLAWIPFAGADEDGNEQQGPVDRPSVRQLVQEGVRPTPKPHIEEAIQRQRKVCAHCSACGVPFQCVGLPCNRQSICATGHAHIFQHLLFHGVSNLHSGGRWERQRRACVHSMICCMPSVILVVLLTKCGHDGNP